MRGRVALALLLVLLLGHVLVSVGWVSRIPAPESTFHNHDLALVYHPKIFRGENWAPMLPVAELTPPSWPGYGPYDLFSGILTNGERGFRSYRVFTPIHYVVSSLPAVVAGVSLMTVRIGPAVVLCLLALAAFDIGRLLTRTHRSSGHAAGLLSAIAVTCVPVGWMGVVIGLPTLGNMTGVTLAIWAMVRSDGLRRIGWAAVAGLLVALASRWGESAGDGLLSMATLAGPVTLSLLLALARLLTRREVRGLLGAAVAVWIAYTLLELEWFQWHLERYVLDEARLSSSSDIPALLERAASNLHAYQRALTWSLIGLSGTVISATGSLLLLRRVRQQPLILVVIAAPLSGLLALAISAKGHDYYAAPVVPALMIAGASGVTLLPGRLRVFSGAAAVWLLSSWLVSAHLDTKALAPVRCTNVVTWGLAGDPTRCLGLLQGREEKVYPWFRIWRKLPDRQVKRRRDIGLWLTRGGGRSWLDGLGPDTLVLLQAPQGANGGFDVVHMIGQSERPDLIFQRVAVGPPQNHAADLISWARQQGSPVVAVTFSGRMHLQDDPPEQPASWMYPYEAGPYGPFVATWRLQ